MHVHFGIKYISFFLIFILVMYKNPKKTNKERKKQYPFTPSRQNHRKSGLYVVVYF